MRKIILTISALALLSACGGRQPQTDSTVTASTEMLAQKEMDTLSTQSYSLTGAIGEDKASIVFGKNDNVVTGVVTRCDYCEPISVEGTWHGDNITVNGVSQAGSHIKYELTVTGKTIQGVEILSAEGEVEEQSVTMAIESLQR